MDDESRGGGTVRGPGIPIGDGEAPPGSGPGSDPAPASKALWTAALATGDVFYVLRVEPDLAFEFVSDSVTDLVGYTPQEHYDDPSLLGRLIDPDDQSRLENALAAPAGVDIEVQLRWVHRDGRAVWTQQRARKRVRDDGSVVLEGSGRDITELRGTQEALAEREENYRLLAENASDVVVRLRADGSVMWVSPSVQTTLGWTPQAFSARSIRDLLHPEDLPRILAKQREVLARGGSDGRGEARYATPDGGWRWMSIVARVVRDDEGRILGAVDSLRDIHAEVEARQALAESRAHYRLLAENASDLVFRLSPDLKVVWVSPSVAEVGGWDPAEVIGRPLLDFIHPDDLPGQVIAAQTVLGGQVMTFEARFRTAAGSFRWLSSRARPALDGDGNVVGIVGGSRDVTGEVEVRQALALSEERFRLLAENASDVVYLVRVDGVLEWVSPSIRDSLGWDADDLAGTRPWDLVHPDDRQAAAASLAEVARSGQAPTSFTLRARHRDGSYRWMSASGHSVQSEGPVVGFVVGLRDVTAEVEAREALTRSERRLRAAMESAPVGMAVVSLDGHFLDVNPALCRMVGRDRQWLLEHATADIIHPDDLPVDHRTHRHVESGAAESARQTIRLLTADGRVLWVDHAVGLLRDDDGTAQSFVAHFVDVSQEHRAQEHLRFQATHDELTSLVNRRELTSRMDLLLRHPPRTETRLGVLFIDVDRLKTVNDTLGHAVGDYLLVQTASRISAQVRAGDVVARVGGDEFVVLLPGLRDQADAERIAAKVRSAATQPLTYDDIGLHPTVSIGVTLARPGQDVDDVLRDADTAAYAAKAAGRDRVIVHPPGPPGES